MGMLRDSHSRVVIRVDTIIEEFSRMSNWIEEDSMVCCFR